MVAHSSFRHSRILTADWLVKIQMPSIGRFINPSAKLWTFNQSAWLWLILSQIFLFDVQIPAESCYDSMSPTKTHTSGDQPAHCGWISLTFQWGAWKVDEINPDLETQFLVGGFNAQKAFIASPRRGVAIFSGEVARDGYVMVFITYEKDEALLTSSCRILHLP